MPHGGTLPVDHLVWGGPNLQQEIERLEDLTGVRAITGGRHPSEGTHNALIRLGPVTYLELIAPDPSQPAPPRPRWFGLDTLASPRLITWAARSADLSRRAAAVGETGSLLGDVRSGRRELSSGHVFSWQLTYPDVRVGDGLVPFLIDWGDSAHPAATAPDGVRLVELRAEHPDPAAIIAHLRHLELELQVLAGPTPALIATLDTPLGRVELR